MSRSELSPVPTSSEPCLNLPLSETLFTFVPASSSTAPLVHTPIVSSETSNNADIQPLSIDSPPLAPTSRPRRQAFNNATAWLKDVTADLRRGSMS